MNILTYVVILVTGYPSHTHKRPGLTIQRSISTFRYRYFQVFVELVSN